MQIQPINKTMPNSTFKAKLSVRTLKTLTEEAKSLEQGNEVLKNILDKIEKIGNKNTILDFGIVTEHSRIEHYNGSAAYDYMDEEDYEVKYGKTLATISNRIFPNISHNHTFELREGANLFDFIQNALDSSKQVSILQKFVENSEVSLFKKYITKFKEKNPKKLATEETFNIIDIINSAFKPEQTKEMIGLTEEIDAASIANKIGEIDTEIKKLSNNKDKLYAQAREANKFVEKMSKIVEDNSTNETKEIFDKYI